MMASQTAFQRASSLKQTADESYSTYLERAGEIFRGTTDKIDDQLQTVFAQRGLLDPGHKMLAKINQPKTIIDLKVLLENYDNEDNDTILQPVNIVENTSEDLTLASPGGVNRPPPLRFFYSRINLCASIITIFADFS